MKQRYIDIILIIFFCFSKILQLVFVMFSEYQKKDTLGDRIILPQGKNLFLSLFTMKGIYIFTKRLIHVIYIINQILKKFRISKSQKLNLNIIY